jgi:hypothetical protein
LSICIVWLRVSTGSRSGSDPIDIEHKLARPTSRTCIPKRATLRTSPSAYLISPESGTVLQ